MEHFFVMGCQRSGTTLMRLVLESHTDIICFDEQSSYAILSGKQTRPAVTCKIIGFKIPIWTEQLLEQTLDGNELTLGSAGWEQTPNFYTGEKILFLIRDPLDTVASMMRLESDSKETWLQLVGLPVMKRKMADQRFAEEFSADLRIIDSSSDQAVAFAALYWKFKSKSLIRYRAANMPVRAVLYEEFVTTPTRVLRDLMNFLGARWEDSLLKHHLLPHSEIENGKAIGNTDSSRSIDHSSIGKWRNVLTASQVDIIRTITGPLEEQFRSLEPKLGL